MNKNRSGRVKRGFTLIELLAVIVILAVIALIAVPVILSLVDKSRRKAAEESAVLYVDTIENMLMLNNVENTDGKTYKVKGRTVVDENGKLVLNLEIKGDVPYNGVENVIKINSGFIEEANLRFNSYYVRYEMDMTTKKFKTCTSQKGFLDKCDGTGEVKPSEPEGPKGDGPTIEMAQDKTYLATVYLDPTDISRKCTKEEAQANVNENGTPTGITSGCMKWYAYKDDGTNYTMLLDHNTTVHIEWNASYDITEMKEVAERLKEDTNAWEDRIKASVRLIGADEIADLTGASREDTISWSKDKIYVSTVYNSKENASDFYFDGKGDSYNNNSGWQAQSAKTPGSSQYTWLYDYTRDCTQRGCNVEDSHLYPFVHANVPREEQIWGYWTNTSVLGTNNMIWVVSSYGQLSTQQAGVYSRFGIRPVIEIPKQFFS
jgi:type IV pilus assembly protein PilA